MMYGRRATDKLICYLFYIDGCCYDWYFVNPGEKIPLIDVPSFKEAFSISRFDTTVGEFTEKWSEYYDKEGIS